jgi:16S rRNA pseudouridine516 synthase
MRLDKLLANMGYGTRTEVKKLCRERRIAVNGTIVTKSDAKVDEEHDTITLDGMPVLYEKYSYFMLNKPAGYISATEGNQPTVMDLIPEGIKGLFPCGRLDKDTTGLLLITNDGDLAHALLAPKNNVEKEYLVGTEKPVTEADVKRLADGITIDGGVRCKPAECIVENEKTCRLILREGKFHEVKRMLEALDNRVVTLKRVRMKQLVLDETLAEGDYRPLTEEETALLKESE